MSRITIELLAGRTIEQKRVAAKEACAALADFCKVPLSETFVRFDEVPFENFGTNRELRSVISEREGKPAYGVPEDPRITVFYVEGPTLDDRRVLVKRLAEKVCAALGVPPEATNMFLLEMKPCDLSIGGTLASNIKK